MRNFTVFFLAMAIIIGFANVSQANDMSYSAFFGEKETQIHAKNSRKNAGHTIGGALREIFDIPENIVEGFKKGPDNDEEVDFLEEVTPGGVIVHLKHHNYDAGNNYLPIDPRSHGYSPVNFGRGCSPAVIVPGSNIVLPVPGTTRSGRAFYAPNSGNLQANIGSRGWNVRLGN